MLLQASMYMDCAEQLCVRWLVVVVCHCMVVWHCRDADLMTHLPHQHVTMDVLIGLDR